MLKCTTAAAVAAVAAVLLGCLAVASGELLRYMEFHR